MKNRFIVKKYLVTSFLIMVAMLSGSMVITGLAFAVESATALKNLETLVKTKSCKGCDLSGLTLNRLDLVGADLEGADLSSSKLSLTNLSRANLKNCDLRGAIFGGTDLSDADLRGADLRGTSLDSSYHQGAQFDGEFIVAKPYADIGESDVEKEVFIADPAKPKQSPETRKVKIGEPTDIDKPSTTITAGKVEPDASMVKASEGKIKRQRPGAASLAPAPAAKKVAPMQQVAVDAPVLNKEISTNPSAASVPDKKEIETQVEIVSVEKATTPERKEQKADELTAIAKSPAEGQVAAEKKISGAASLAPPSAAKKVTPMQQVVVDAPQLTAIKVPKTPKTVEDKPTLEPKVEVSSQKTEVDKVKEDNLKRLLDKNKCYGCDLSGLDLSGKNLDSADLEKADLTGSNLEKADLEKANLKGALLVKANLRKAKLKNADFYKADLAGADLTEARVEGAMFDGAQIETAVGLTQETGGVDK